MAWIIYRDKKTGRFVKKQVYKRAKKRGNKRYVRKQVKKVSKKKKPISKRRPAVRERIQKEQVFEWIVSFSYDKSGRSFDVITTARSETETYEVAREFLMSTPDGKNIVRAGFSGWKVVPSKGKLSNEEPGEAEYRNKSNANKKKTR